MASNPLRLDRNMVMPVSVAVGVLGALLLGYKWVDDTGDAMDAAAKAQARIEAAMVRLEAKMDEKLGDVVTVPMFGSWLEFHNVRSTDYDLYVPAWARQR